MINIGFLTHGDRNIGGGENSWHLLINQLDKEKFKPIIIYSVKNGLINNLIANSVCSKHINISKRLSKVYRDNINYNPHILLLNIFLMIKAIIELTHILVNQNIEILHVHDNLSKILGIIPTKLLNKKIITHCNDQLKNSFIDKLLIYLQRKYMDKVFCVSKFVANTFRHQGILPNNIEVIYSSVDVEFWKNNLIIKNNLRKNNSTNFCIAMIAVFDKVKGHKYLFNAIKLMLDENINDIECLIVGTGREEQSLKSWVNKYGLTKYIKFLGFVDDLSKIMINIDVLVVPSTQESFGMSAVEAMSMKIPVIATDVGGLPEVVLHNKTGIIVENSNELAIKNALVYLKNNPNIQIELGNNGPLHVYNNFNIIDNIIKTENILANMITK